MYPLLFLRISSLNAHGMLTLMLVSGAVAFISWPRRYFKVFNEVWAPVIRPLWLALPTVSPAAWALWKSCRQARWVQSSTWRRVAGNLVESPTDDLDPTGNDGIEISGAAIAASMPTGSAAKDSQPRKTPEPTAHGMDPERRRLLEANAHNPEFQAHATEPLRFEAIGGDADMVIGPPPIRVGPEMNGHNEHDKSGYFHYLACEITGDLTRAATNETIHLCGLAPLHIITTRPEDVMSLAHSKLQAVPYGNAPMQWRRLFEEASLYRAVELLQAQSNVTAHPLVEKGKRRCIADGTVEVSDGLSEWLTSIVTLLDRAIMLTGAPGRRATFDRVLQQLDNVMPPTNDDDLPTSFTIERPQLLVTDHHIARSKKPMDLEAFHVWMHAARKPTIISGMLEHWPASQLWSSPQYLMRRTLGGRRLVPVEVGRSYTDEGWRQRVMPMREYITKYLLPTAPAEIGYLAQHDLFAQIPALREDVLTPDYCYIEPAPVDKAALRTAGLKDVEHLDEPLLNAWLGPRGTTTPLHTDPYDNVLCQVVGYKYVRLYAPNQTPKLYPWGVDDNGINMDNTSSVDVSHVRTRSLGGTTDLDAVREIRKRYPLFEQAKYVEGILGPGESLYVPLGWWHYVESLSTSFSVSFWWN